MPNVPHDPTWRKVASQAAAVGRTKEPVLFREKVWSAKLDDVNISVFSEVLLDSSESGLKDG